MGGLATGSISQARCMTSRASRGVSAVKTGRSDWHTTISSAWPGDRKAVVSL